MMKKVFVAGILLLLASSAFAWNVGQTLTQQEFNDVDFSAQSLSLEVTALRKTEEKIEVDVSYNTLDWNETNWSVVRKPRTFFYRMQDYYDCRGNGGKVIPCISKIGFGLWTKAVNFREAEKNRLRKHQVKSWWSEVNVKDIVIDELN